MLVAYFSAQHLRSFFILALAVCKPGASYHSPYIVLNIPRLVAEFHDFTTSCDKGNFQLVAAFQVTRVVRRHSIPLHSPPWKFIRWDLRGTSLF